MFVSTDSFDAIGCEVRARSVLCLVRITGGVGEVTGLGAVVPLGLRTGDALNVRLIENHAAFSDDAVLRLVNRHLVSLQAIRADAYVDEIGRASRRGRV